MKIDSKIAAYLVSLALLGATLTGSHVFAATPDSGSTPAINPANHQADQSRASDLWRARQRIDLEATRLCARDPVSLSRHEYFIECLTQASADAQLQLQEQGG